MKNIFPLLAIMALVISFISCGEKCNPFSGKDTIVVHDTVMVSLCDTISYNLPCRVMTFNMDKPGKAILIIWLHGGINMDLNWNTVNDKYENRYTWPKADDNIANYLKESKTKAVFLLPICHKANNPYCRRWVDCAEDIKLMIDDYVKSGIVDKQRVYITGSSDGGYGVWDIVEKYGNVFAAAVPLSCNGARPIKDIPIYWNNTRNEGDQTALANELKAQGIKLDYCHHPDKGHGEDEYVLGSTKYMDKILANKSNIQ